MSQKETEILSFRLANRWVSIYISSQVIAKSHNSQGGSGAESVWTGSRASEGGGEHASPERSTWGTTSGVSHVLTVTQIQLKPETSDFLEPFCTDNVRKQLILNVLYFVTEWEVVMGERQLWTATGLWNISPRLLVQSPSSTMLLEALSNIIETLSWVWMATMLLTNRSARRVMWSVTAVWCPVAFRPKSSDCSNFLLRGHCRPYTHHTHSKWHECNACFGLNEA